MSLDKPEPGETFPLDHVTAMRERNHALANQVMRLEAELQAERDRVHHLANESMKLKGERTAAVNDPLGRRIDRLEAWARQFPRTFAKNHPFPAQPEIVALPDADIRPLDEVQP